MGHRTRIAALCVALGLSLGAGPALAGPVSLTYRGEVTTATEGNLFGAMVGDAVVFTVSADPTLVPGGLPEMGGAVASPTSGIRFRFMLGTFTIDSSFDRDFFADCGATLLFQNGDLQSLNFRGDFSRLFPGVTLDDAEISVLGARFSTVAFPAFEGPQFRVDGTLGFPGNRVPEPPALGLLGLAGLALGCTLLRRGRLA